MLTLRGLSGDEQGRTLVLMNGVPINTSDEGGVNWNRINHNDIERIEVFKGPGSSLYGNNAMGGVINIITRTPSQPQEIYGAVTYGTFNTMRQDLSIRVRNEKGYYGSVSQYFLKSDGYINVPEEDRGPYNIARFLEEMSVSARAGFDGKQWFKWELQYDVFRDKRGEGDKIISPLGNYRSFNTNLFRGKLGGANDVFSYDINSFYQLENYYDINERMRGDNYSRYDVNSYRTDMGLLAGASYKLTENHIISAGFELKQGGIKGGDYYQTAPFDTIYNAGTIQTTALYIQDELNILANRISLVAGLRYDLVAFGGGDFYTTDPWKATPELNDNVWSEISPRVGARFNFIEQVSAYLSYSHGFRASILDDLTRTGWMWVGPKYANPELGPESMDNYELGVDIFPFKELKISASAYYAPGKDFLYYVATSDSLFGRAIHIRENVTDVTVGGMETELEYQLSTKLRMNAGYTYASSKINAFEKRPELEGKSFKYAPRHTASASVFHRNRFFDIGLTSLYKGKQFSNDANTATIDPYITFDMHISKKFFDIIDLSVDIHDVLDNQHMETSDYLSPGRIINTRITIKF
jgi:iron complex outermembrane receptor protein